MTLEEYRQKKSTGTLPKKKRLHFSRIVDGHKRCTKCGENKPLNEYDYAKKSLELRASWCKKCKNFWALNKWRSSEKCKHKWTKDRPEEQKETDRKISREKAVEKRRKKIKKMKDQDPAAYAKYREKRQVIERRSRESEVNRLARRVREKQRRQSDVEFAMVNRCRARMRKAMKNNWKNKRTVDLLGCSGKQLAKYLESMFTAQMSWDNYGSYWHIDHVVPCASFDLSKPEEQSRCFHYTNLRPLNALENISKSDRSGYSHQPAFMELVT